MPAEATIEEAAIATFGPVHSRSMEEIMFACPDCGKHSLSVNGLRGVYHCFRCGFGKGRAPLTGRASGLKLPPIDFEQHVRIVRSIVELGSLETGHRDYLLRRGIYRPERYGIVTVPAQLERILLHRGFSQEELLASGLFVSGSTAGIMPVEALRWGRILIPYHTGGQIVGCKTRVNPLALDEEADRPKYLIPRGSEIGHHPYHIGPLKRDALVTEAEIKGIVGMEHNFSCANFSGMNASKQAMSELASLALRSGTERLFVCMDNEPDCWDNFAILKAMHQVAGLMTARTAIVIIPRPSPAEKGELDTFLVRNGEQDLTGLLEDAWATREKTYTAIGRRVRELRYRRPTAPTKANGGKQLG